MCDQLKAFVKYLFLGIFLLSAHAKEPVSKDSLDSARVKIKDDQKSFQTVIWSYQKDNRQIDLVGVIHIGDKAYYQKLNKHFTTYDTVFFEMTGTKASIANLQRNKAKKAEKKYEGLNQLYSLYQSLMDLTLQVEVVDYSQNNFIHADMTADEFHKAQKEAGEDITDAILSSNIDLSEVDQGIMMRAMMTGESNLLKNEIMTLMQKADEAMANDENSVLISGRNDKCLQIVNENLETNQKIKKAAIFYGAAHLPDFHHKLLKSGWKRTDTQWLNAWVVPADIKNNQ